MGFLTKSGTNLAVQPQKIVIGFKFWIKEVEELYYLCSKNKDADQLCGYSATDLHICFCIYAKSRFSHDVAQIVEQISLLYNMLVKKSAVSRYMYL